MDQLENLARVIEEETALLGFELVKFDQASRGRKRVLRIFIDRPESGVTIDDCVKVSKALGLILEDDKLIRGPFHLEVSSPGMNRPLTKSEHFVRFAGREARIELSGDDGRKRTVIGRIESCDGESVVVAAEGREETIALDSIMKARLHGEKWDIGKDKAKGR